MLDIYEKAALRILKGYETLMKFDDAHRTFIIREISSCEVAIITTSCRALVNDVSYSSGIIAVRGDNSFEFAAKLANAGFMFEGRKNVPDLQAAL